MARDAKPKVIVPAPRFDASAASNIVDVQGIARTVVGVHEPSGKLKLKIGDAPPFAADGTFGAQLAIGDLDQDGVPEIASSADGPDDAVQVWSWQGPDAGLRPRLRLPAPAGVRALTICPPEEHGEPVLVAITGSELWLVRAGERAEAQR